MLIKILRLAGVRRRDTLFVGDLDKDREAARRAGVRFLWAHEFFNHR